VKRGAPLKRHKPLRTSREKRTGRRDTGPARPTRLTVLERDEYRCSVCGQSVLEIPFNIHHRRNRGAGGSSDPAINAPSNLLTVCGTGTTGCHGWIGSSPAEALEHGYTVSLNSREATTDVPVVHAVHGVVYLLDDGALRLPPEWGGAA
jgi:hypothetical protein